MGAQASPPGSVQPVPGLKHIVSVGSGKGGVGKTTVAVNLSIALSQLGFEVGLLDADVYGPNVPLMLGLSGPVRGSGQKIEPLEQFGIRVMSIGFLAPPQKPIIWRGPMLHSAIRQFVHDVAWGELDFLVVDLPPGTGDAPLSLIQTVPLTGALIVTTPSDVSLLDARKAVNMFRQLNVEVLGIVENMSYLVVPETGQLIDAFGRGGGKRLAEEMQAPLLGEIPLDPRIRIGGDTGRPVALVGDAEPHAAAFLELARNVVQRVEEVSGSQPAPPTIEIED